MVSTACELCISVAVTDHQYLAQTIPHLVRSCGDAVQRRTLVLDTAPVTGTYARQRDCGSLAELREIAAGLKKDGWVDEVVEIPYSPQAVRDFNRRTFGRPLKVTHNIRGAPLYGHAFLIDPDRSPYVVHFDADMLVHQTPGRSWIREGIALLQKHPELLCVLPLSGPPRPDGSITQPDCQPVRDPDGFWRFNTFTTRIYLMDARRYQALLPMKLLFLSRREALRAWLTGRGQALAFESALTHHLQKRGGTFRADLADGFAWHVHPSDKGPAFVQQLPRLIPAIEQGRFPPAQAGHYDLQLPEWAAWLDGASCPA